MIEPIRAENEKVNRIKIKRNFKGNSVEADRGAMRTFYKFKGKNIKKSCDHAGGPGLFSFSSGE